MSKDTIVLAHGSGGRLTHELIRRVFVRHFSNPMLNAQDDAAVWTPPRSEAARLAFSTDSYVVQPIFFPGGDIGKLAVCGTVNDLAMVGAQPLYLSASFILEEGLPLADLERIVASMAATAREAGVEIIAGDTKVVDRGSADQVFISTAGVGVVPDGTVISGANAKPGDLVIVSGPIGVHGLSIMSHREGLQFSFPLASDCAPLNGLVAAMLQVDKRIHCLRDPTRGGLATTLNEIAGQSKVGIEIDEAQVPVPESVQAACELLGLDPFYAANEGKLVAIVAPQAGSAILEAMQRHPYGEAAAVIGRVTSTHRSRVVLQTVLGAHRILDMLTGAQLPRIC
ncbi:MAG: hydrogenase expression/formation protein HypE [Anaerolineales bacterium]|nr:MAG: hydrogenase expression/formation protein HypE [Anaerolineales bacterium]